MIFPELSNNSKVWIYTSNRPFSESEQVSINHELQLFLKQWAAHGDSLYGNATVLHDRFVVLAVDEAQTIASGCSIDTSVQFIKALGAELNVDFFDRLNLVVEKDGELSKMHLGDLKENQDLNVFNPMVTKLDELRNNWLIPVSSSPFV